MCDKWGDGQEEEDGDRGDRGENSGCHIRCGGVELKKASSYIAQYPVLRTAQSALHFTSLTDLYTQYTISASLGSIQPYATITARRLLVHISTAVYSQVLIYIAE